MQQKPAAAAAAVLPAGAAVLVPVRRLQLPLLARSAILPSRLRLLVGAPPAQAQAQEFPVGRPLHRQTDHRQLYCRHQCSAK